MDKNIFDDIIGVDNNNCVRFKSLDEGCVIFDEIIAEKNKKIVFALQKEAFKNIQPLTEEKKEV